MICQIPHSPNANCVKRVLDGDVLGYMARVHTCIREQERTSIDIEATAHVRSLRSGFRAHMVRELSTGHAFLVSGSARCSSCAP